MNIFQQWKRTGRGRRGRIEQGNNIFTVAFLFPACTPCFEYKKWRTAEWQKSSFCKNIHSNKLVHLVLRIKILQARGREKERESKICQEGDISVIFLMQFKFCQHLSDQVSALWRDLLYLLRFSKFVRRKQERALHFIVNIRQRVLKLNIMN